MAVTKKECVDNETWTNDNWALIAFCSSTMPICSRSEITFSTSILSTSIRNRIANRIMLQGRKSQRCLRNRFIKKPSSISCDECIFDEKSHRMEWSESINYHFIAKRISIERGPFDHGYIRELDRSDRSFQFLSSLRTGSLTMESWYDEECHLNNLDFLDRRQTDVYNPDLSIQSTRQFVPWCDL